MKCPDCKSRRLDEHTEDLITWYKCKECFEVWTEFLLHKSDYAQRVNVLLIARIKGRLALEYAKNKTKH